MSGSRLTGFIGFARLGCRFNPENPLVLQILILIIKQQFIFKTFTTEVNQQSLLENRRRRRSFWLYRHARVGGHPMFLIFYGFPLSRE